MYPELVEGCASTCSATGFDRFSNRELCTLSLSKGVLRRAQQPDLIDLVTGVTCPELVEGCRRVKWKIIKGVNIVGSKQFSVNLFIRTHFTADTLIN